jgi:hypothetical protein
MPTASKRFYQRNGRGELLAAQLHGAELDVQLRGLSRCHFEIRDQPITVTVVGGFQLVARSR